MPINSSTMSIFTENIQDSDIELIRSCREGKLSAWEHMLDRYERLVLSVPSFYGLGSEDAADIAQLTFTILLQNIDTLREDSNLKAWLCTIARRQSWRLLKRGQHESLEAVDEEFSRSGAELMGRPVRDGVSDSIEHWELMNWIQQGLGHLNGRCLELIQALYFSEQQPTYVDLAARLNMPVGAIGPTRARCLARLKQFLGSAQENYVFT